MTKCKECGKCAQACPYNAIAHLKRPCKFSCPVNAITYNEYGISVIDEKKCIRCGKCIHSCPFGAIGSKTQIVDVINAIKDENKKVYAMCAPATEGQFGPNITMNSWKKAMLALGFSGFVEVGLGGDMTAAYEAEEWLEAYNEGIKKVTSCCPAFVKYIETKNEVDESGKRYRTEEEIEYSTTDPDYSKKTGVGFHSYPFPCYGDGVMDSTGSTYTKNNKEEVIAAYNEEEKAACEAWNVELLADIFPQADKFAVPAFSPVWAYTTPSEFDEITTQLDEIAWSSLISCVMASEDKFDETYDKMISDLESAGMKDAETMLSDIIKEKAGV